MLMPGGLVELAEFHDRGDQRSRERFHKTTSKPIHANTPHHETPGTTNVVGQGPTTIGHGNIFSEWDKSGGLCRRTGAAQHRDKIRKERQKSTENLAGVCIEPPLKTSAGWEVWAVALETALKLAYGSKGVPLSYVIQKDEAPNLIGHPTWEEMAIHGAPHNGLDWEADRMTVHLFILNNIGQDSDANTYIQPLLSRNNGRRDIIALLERYDNEATIQTRVNEANKTWELLVYKNERAMSLEVFCQKFQNALQHFERAGQAKHDGDVIDWIWQHIQNTELGQTLAVLKASQSMHARTPMQILQGVAKEIPNLSQGTFQQRISEVHIDDHSNYTFEGKRRRPVPTRTMDDYFAVLARMDTGSATKCPPTNLRSWKSVIGTQNIVLLATGVEEGVEAPADATRTKKSTV